MITKFEPKPNQTPFRNPKNSSTRHAPKFWLDSDFIWILRRFLSISPQEATASKRGFQIENESKKHHLEKIGLTFLAGYQAVINDERLEVFIPQLQAIEPEYKGFAFEGAGMALTLLDILTPWQRNRFPEFLAKEGGDHIYMAYVGAGWALGRIPGSLNRYLSRLTSTSTFPDFLLGWLALDGYGFHQGYFYWRKYIEGICLELSGYPQRVFDQGLGRSLWFVKGADIGAILQGIEQFQPKRRADLWSGIGLACTYAGGVSLKEIKILWENAGQYRPQVAQGAVFAAKARLRANNLTESTEMAVRVFCEMSISQAAEVSDRALIGLSPNGEIPSYEQWRKVIQGHFQF